MPIKLDVLHKKSIDSFILQYPYTFFAYGSRVKGTCKDYSDLDLCIMEKVPLLTLAKIKEGLNSLILPFSIDLVSWPTLSEEFQNNIKKDLIRYMPDPYLNAEITELSHAISDSCPAWPGKKYELIVDSDYDNLFRINSLHLASGLGTHIDFPAHMIAGGKDATSLKPEKFTAPCSIFYVAEKDNAQFVITQQMLELFEHKHGPIPQDSWFLILTGWGKKAENAQLYCNYNKNNIMQFPTVDKEAAQFLLSRKIRGLGIDTLSPDAQNSTYPVHTILLGNNILIIENVKYVPDLPASRGQLQVVPLSIKGATESPARLIYVTQKS